MLEIIKTMEGNDNRNAARAKAISPDNSDLHDSVGDEIRMEEKEISMDLPDVEDIPGQKNIVPPKMNSYSDTTIASDDEEGTNVFDVDNDEISDED
jgi:hypothetical protein